MMLKCDAVFEGGGVKGIGFAGAVRVIEEAGYSFQNLAGTSAGAIVAALLAVGYTGEEIEEELLELDYTCFRECTTLSSLGILGKGASLALFWGAYKADYFENWITGLLARKNKLVFGDILTTAEDSRYKYKFQAIASDISDKRMLVLPGDLKGFGINPDEFPIGRAVRMSMSIPFYYIPYKLKRRLLTSIIVDGGLLSNYPVWLLDDGTSEPPWPTFGFKFTEGSWSPVASRRINNIIDYGKSIVETLMEGHDNREIRTQKGDHMRSIIIPVELEDGTTVKTTDFDITREQSVALLSNGARAAEKFLSDWDFEKWKRVYR